MTNWRKILSWQVYHPSWDTLSEDKKNILLQDKYDGNLDLSHTPITDLGNLQHVGGNLDLSHTPITDLGNLQHVGGNLDLYATFITDLGRLEYVGRNLSLWNTSITDLGNLQSVGGSLFLVNTPIARMNEEERNRVVGNVEVGGEIIYEEEE